MTSPTRYSPEVRERAVGLVLDHQGEHDSQWSAITSVSSKLGCTAETLRKWVRQAERDRGVRAGLSSEERRRLKELERENRELRRANEILRKASAYLSTFGRQHRSRLRAVVAAFKSVDEPLNGGLAPAVRLRMPAGATENDGAGQIARCDIAPDRARSHAQPARDLPDGQEPVDVRRQAGCCGCWRGHCPVPCREATGPECWAPGRRWRVKNPQNYPPLRAAAPEAAKQEPTSASARRCPRAAAPGPSKRPTCATPASPRPGTSAKRCRTSACRLPRRLCARG